MPELNPYEAPQSELQPAAEVRRPTVPRSVDGSLALERMVLVQGLCIFVGLQAMWNGQNANIFWIVSTIISLFALERAYRHGRTGWVVFEVLLLTALVTLLLCLKLFAR